MIADHNPVQSGQTRTEFVQFPNREGLGITACIDHAGELHSRPWVLVAPKFGETKKSNLQLAYYLAANGLNVLRFDHTNHVGESEGEALRFVLPGAVGDIHACLDYLEEKYGARKVIIVANSLSARCALRAAASDPRVARFISVAGVVNLLATMSEIYQEDILAQYRAGRRWGVTNFLGLDVHGDEFLDTTLAAGLYDLAGTIADAAKLQVPMIYFYAERDAWVRSEEVAQVVGANPRARRVMVPAAMHEVRENPKAAEQLFREVIWACLYDGPCPDGAAQGWRTPDRRLLMEENRRERERLRQVTTPAESEKEFWSGYLKKYAILERSTDYQEYLAQLARLCRPLPAGAAVLDAGCGNGMFGHWVLREAGRQRSGGPGAPTTVYVGLDLTPRGLADAMQRHVEMQRPAVRGIPAGVQYSLADFDQLADGTLSGGLPFADNTFDLVCCSLVLSYLKNPAVLLRELHRVQKPGGVFVASSMKPHCDLSVIYRDSISLQVTPEEVEAGRNLLRAAGKIKLKEESGHYAFYSQAELAGLVLDAGFNVQESLQSLGDQAVVIKAAK